MAWNWRKDWSVMGLLRMLVLFFYCRVDVNFHLGDLFLQTDDLTDSSGVVLKPWTVRGAFKIAAPCVWVVDGGWLISPKAFFPQNGHGAFWNDAFQFLSDVRCLIFLLQRSNQFGDELYFTKSRRPRSEAHLPEMSWLQIFDNLIVHCAIRSTLKVIAKAKTPQKIQTKIWGISSGGFCACVFFFFNLCSVNP